MAAPIHVILFDTIYPCGKISPTMEEPHGIINIILMLSTKDNVAYWGGRIMNSASVYGAHYSINCEC
jgi:hypothetical protein